MTVIQVSAKQALSKTDYYYHRISYSGLTPPEITEEFNPGTQKDKETHPEPWPQHIHNKTHKIFQRKSNI